MKTLLILIVLLLLFPASTLAQKEISFRLLDDGTIPAWLALGPIDQGTVGFGTAVDADSIGEASARPVEGEIVRSAMVRSGSVSWIGLSPRDGFVDFHEAFSWHEPSDKPEKIVKAHAAYAFVRVYVEQDREAYLLAGSNGHAKVLLNGEEVFRHWTERNAHRDSDTIAVRLRRGENRLLVKVLQTHRNESIQFFVPIEWQWGFYARLVDVNMQPLRDAEVRVDMLEEPLSASLEPTFFFPWRDGELKQRMNVFVHSRTAGEASAEVTVELPGGRERVNLERVPFGQSLHVVETSPVEQAGFATLNVSVGGQHFVSTRQVAPAPRYELHLMLLNHTDIGYTNPQPVVVERLTETLDDVLDLCDTNPAFRWTIETVWQLDHYERSRPPEVFNRLMDHVQRGCVALSPVFTNPYTGWLGEEELLRSMEPALEYAQRYGIRYPAAVYNDVPGFSHFLPRVLHETNTRFLIAGINELFNDYLLQRTMPKVFRWTGKGGASVVTYRTEAYNEGQTYGMVKGREAMLHRTWNRLLRYRAQGHEAEVLLVNTTLGDNGGIPRLEFDNALAWNEDYAYPRIVVTTAHQFAERYLDTYGDDLPEVTGDWTSTWDILYQGETARMIRQRRAQHNLHAAEILAALTWLGNDMKPPLEPVVAEAYRGLLEFSGHGSGLEYAYGSPEENKITMEFREQYVRNALMASEEALQRAGYRLLRPEVEFEAEGVTVFNPYSWAWDAPVVAAFPAERNARFRVTDLRTGALVPSTMDGHRLVFIARGLPPVGFVKYRIDPWPQEASGTGGVLEIGEDFISNERYRIEFDISKGRISRVIADGKDLIREGERLPFGLPARAAGTAGDTFEALDLVPVNVTFHDDRPVRVSAVLEFDHPVFPELRIDLWDGIDRVDLAYSVNLGGLEAPLQIEEYAIAFPFDLDTPLVSLELPGGFADDIAGRFSSIAHDAYSIRRSVRLADEHTAIAWSAIDSRVVRIRHYAGEGSPVLLANVVNNFPLNWNRWEENRGTWPFRFSFSAGSSDLSETEAMRLGWQAAMSAIATRTWFRTSNPAHSHFSLDGEDVTMPVVRAHADAQALTLRLVNHNRHQARAVTVSSPWFKNSSACRSDLMPACGETLDLHQESFSLTLRPSEVATVTIFRNRSPGARGAVISSTGSDPSTKP
jgi:hypothetical protein